MFSISCEKEQLQASTLDSCAIVSCIYWFI